MSDYTPTTYEIRHEYTQSDIEGELLDGRHSAAFDRWLAAHDAEMIQRGREDAAKAVEAVMQSEPTEAEMQEWMPVGKPIDGAWLTRKAVAAARGESAE